MKNWKELEREEQDKIGETVHVKKMCMFSKGTGKSWGGSRRGITWYYLYSKKITLAYEEETGVRQVGKNVHQWESIIVVKAGDDAGLDWSGGNGSGESSLIQDIFCG